MGILEIILLAAGAVIFIGSFLIPVKEEKLKEETKNLAAEEVKSLVSEELETVRERLTELSEEEMREQIKKSERSMERISNEKIMAVNEYSDTVLEEIHKNHEEVVFLYDMLKNKKEALSESYGKADQNLQDLLQQLKDSEITLRENLEEVARKQKELKEAGEKPEAKAEIVREETAKAQTSARKKTAHRAEKKDSVGEAAAAQDAPAESDFKPFTPERIEVTPKKTRKRKTTKKPEQPEPEAAAGSPAESAEVMLLLSDTMEDEAGINSNERILELHKAGKSNMAIARELGLGIGEVKLVIDLYESVR